MTDEEQAMTQFKNTFCTTCEDKEICDISILDCTAYDSIYKQAYLAGLKAGRPKWHKVADGDLPSNDRYVWTNVGACYYDEAGWWDDFGRLQDVIAWCEPKFKE